MDNYDGYWDNHLFFQTDDLVDSYFDDSLSYYDSSSPDGNHSSATSSKNIVSERNRRKKLNERLFALRAVVPNISKMDKASIIKDAIDYIEALHDEERRMRTEISELESRRTVLDFDPESGVFSKSKRARYEQQQQSSGSDSGSSSAIEVSEMRVFHMGERTIVVSVTCSKGTDTMVKICEAFESLDLKILTATIATLSGKLLKTIFIEAEEEEKDVVKIKIETAIAALNDPGSPMST